MMDNFFDGGITESVECRVCGTEKFVDSQEEADEWAKNHKCSLNLKKESQNGNN